MSEELRRMVDELSELRAELESVRCRAGLRWLSRSCREAEIERQYRDLLHITSRRLVDEVGFERCATILASALEGGAT